MMDIFYRSNITIIFLVLFVCAPMYVCAQEVRRGPDLQTSDGSFFDPTRAPEKVEELYRFGIEYRLEAGYVQNNERSGTKSYPDMYLHGGRLGATFTFLLPSRFSLQAGVLYSIAYGVTDQHWHSVTQETVQTEYIRHRVLEHQLVVPVRAFYTVPLWKDLNLFFYGGPQLQVGLSESDNMESHLSVPMKAWLKSEGVRTESYDRLGEGELGRCNIQLGVGGGLEWGRYRLQAGYDFGLNNLIMSPVISDQHMWEWGWYTSFSYRL